MPEVERKPRRSCRAVTENWHDNPSPLRGDQENGGDHESRAARPSGGSNQRTACGAVKTSVAASHPKREYRACFVAF